ARILDPLGAPDGARQRRPVALALEADDPEPAPVAVLVAVDRRVPHRLAVPDRDLHAEAQRRREVERDRVEALAQERGLDELAAPAALAREQRRADARCGREARAVVAHAAALEGRLTAGLRQEPRDARARPEGGDVVGRAVGVRPAAAVAGEERIDEPRVDGE